MRRRAPVVACLPMLAATWLAGDAGAQQVADLAFAPPIPQPAFAAGTGPVVLLDEAHHNFHTATGRYEPFARLLRRDGYRVQASAVPFTADALREAGVLVIANALHERNRQEWTLPTPSAFSEAEIAAVRAWVQAGGSLLLIADHMPMAGAAEALGAAFGVTWNNGFAMDSADPSTPFVFTREGPQVLGTSPITEGRSVSERVTSVATFTGSAFRAGPDATAVLTLRPGIVSLMPKTAWEFGPDTARQDVGGWLQGAVFEVGKGRVAVFGEAAMFSAQLAGPEKVPMGMNAPNATQNPQLLINVLHWLTRVI
jgi:hypothetical protein